MYNWAVVTITQTPGVSNERIQTTTNNPCHLTLYWTLNIPLRHKDTRTFRGLVMPWGAYFCFTAWIALPQQEAGDTLVHTFNVIDWPHCQTRWFCFAGTVSGFESPSISAIYEKHHRARHTYTLLPTKDVYIDKNHPTTNYSHLRYVVASGYPTHPGFWRIALFTFDIAFLPRAYFLREATLTLHFITSNAQGHIHLASKLLFGGWSETEATFQQLSAGRPWSSGDFSPTDYVTEDPVNAAAFVPNLPAGDVYWNLRPIVEDGRSLPDPAVHICVFPQGPALGFTWYSAREAPWIPGRPELEIICDQYP